MNPKLAEDTKSPITHGQARDSLAQAYRELFNKEPSDGELDFGLAAAFFETQYGRGGGASWAKSDQFSKWSSEGKYNWGGLQSGVPGNDPALQKFRSAGLHPVKEKSLDAGRPRYFYLFPNDLEAAKAFLMSWGKPSVLKAATSGDHNVVAKTMKDHGYYEGLWVPPGNPKGLEMPPFKEAGSAEEAERNNIRDYGAILKSQKAVVTKPEPLPQLPPPTKSVITSPTALSTQASLTREADAFLRIAEGSPLPKFTHGQAREALAQAYKNLFHKDPSEGELDFGLATAFFETGYGRAGGANLAHPGQFARCASEGKYNWGALETSIPGEEGTMKKFQSAGLHPTKEKGKDAGRPVYFYLFPNDLEAATAFLMSWGRPDTLKAASSGSSAAVAESMLKHNYYEGFHVAPGKMTEQMLAHNKEDNGKCSRNGTCFIQESSAEDARRQNIGNYASALNGHVAAVTGRSKRKMEPEQQLAAKAPSSGLEGFLDKISQYFTHLFGDLSSMAGNENENFLIIVGAEDLTTKAEYARILQSVLREELKTEATIHTHNDVLEVSCQLPFSQENSLLVLEEVCSAVSNTFEFATKNAGGYQTCTVIHPNQKSAKREMDINLSEINRRLFKLKFAKGSNVGSK